MQRWAAGLIRDVKQALRFLRSDIPFRSAPWDEWRTLASGFTVPLGSRADAHLFAGFRQDWDSILCFPIFAFTRQVSGHGFSCFVSGHTLQIRTAVFSLITITKAGPGQFY